MPVRALNIGRLVEYDTASIIVSLTTAGAIVAALLSRLAGHEKLAVVRSSALPIAAVAAAMSCLHAAGVGLAAARMTGASRVVLDDAAVTLSSSLPGVLAAYLPICCFVLRQARLLRVGDRWAAPSPIPRVGVGSSYGAGAAYLVLDAPSKALLGAYYALYVASLVAAALNAALPVSVLNVSGVLAVAYDLGIPTWNAVRSGDGSDTRVTNVFEGVDFDVEILGVNQYSPTWTVSPDHDAAGKAAVTVRKFFIHNGHTQSAALRDVIPMRMEFADDPEPATVAKTILDVSRSGKECLSQLYAASTGSPADDVRAALGVLSVLLPERPWASGRGQRLRLQTLARCCALMRSAGNRLGHRWTNTDHDARGCGCVTHRVLNRSPLAATPDDAMAQWFGATASAQLHWADEQARAYGEAVWDALKVSMTGHFENRPFMLWIFLVALESLAKVRFSEPDWFPSGTWPMLSLCSLGMQGRCCSQAVGSDSPETGNLLDRCVSDVEEGAGRGEPAEPPPARQLWPPPKSVAHVAQRVLRKAALVQAGVSAIILARQLT